MTDRPTFKEWLKQPADHRRRTAAQVMSKVDEMIAQQDEEGTHAIMLAFKLADRDEAGNTGVSGCLPPEVFKDTIREICGTRMQGWNDFEGMYNVSPRQLEYCVEIAEKAPVRKPVWQFQDNTGQWRDYDLHDEPNGAAIEEAKREGKAQFEMKIRGRLVRLEHRFRDFLCACHHRKSELTMSTCVAVHDQPGPHGAGADQQVPRPPRHGGREEWAAARDPLHGRAQP